MNLFKKRHTHSYHYDADIVYKQAFQDIIVKHNEKTLIIEKCSCGAIRERSISLDFRLDWN